MRLLSAITLNDVNRYLVEGAQIEAWQNPPPGGQLRCPSPTVRALASVLDGVTPHRHRQLPAFYPVYACLGVRLSPEPWAIPAVPLSPRALPYFGVAANGAPGDAQRLAAGGRLVPAVKLAPLVRPMAMRL